MDYGLTAQGFVSKDLQTIKTELEDAFKVTFGSDLDVSAESVAGQIIGNMSLKFANVWDILAAVYASFNPDSASDTSLDRAVALVNVKRTPATATEVYVTMYGDEGAVIPLYHMTSQANGNIFKLAVATTISSSRLTDTIVNMPSDPVAGQHYIITVNSTELDYLAGVSDDKLAILNELKDMINVLDLPVSASVDSDALTLRIYANDGFTYFAVVLSANLEFTKIGTPGRYLADTLGELQAPVGSVNTITQPVSGLDSVNNLAAGTPGRNIETDTELRDRRRSSLFSYGYATDEAIRSRILQEVSEVSYVRVISNREDATDGAGRPGHSTEVVVMGGDTTLIAEKLWEVFPAGTGFYGNTTVVIDDSNGDPQTIKFSRPTPKYIWVKITLTLSLEEDFPVTGATMIKNNIVNWALANVSSGVDVVYQKLFAPVYSVAGIADAVIEVGATDDPGTPPVSYSQANIPISSSQLAVFDFSRMEVEIL